VGIELKRRTYRIGASRVVTLPLAWCNYYRDRIDTVTIIEDGVLILAPQGLEERAQRMIKQLEEETNSKGGNKG